MSIHGRGNGLTEGIAPFLTVIQARFPFICAELE